MNGNLMAGMKYTWEDKRLVKVKNLINEEIKYSYDSTGKRTKKGLPTKTINYYYTTNNLLSETHSDGTIIRYIYENNNIIGFKLKKNNETKRYLYMKDMLSNIIGIINEEGTIVTRYSYTAYGKVTIKEYSEEQIGEINPIRYKGYYYDSETLMYYLMTRYYDPELCRFISPDDVSYLDPSTINGLNLYCYCYNNPISYADPSGHFAISTFLIGLAVSSLVTWGLSEIFGAQIVGGASSMVNGYGAITTGVGLLSFGPVGWVTGGLLIIAGAGAMIIGANEIVDGITGTNYIQEWTGWSDDLYNGLYIGSNIISSVGTIAGNIYMKYNPPYPGRNPNKIPDGFNDRVNPKANYYNPKTDQSLRPDLNHAEPIGPHWDWIDSNGVGWRLYRYWRIRK